MLRQSFNGPCKVKSFTGLMTPYEAAKVKSPLELGLRRLTVGNALRKVSVSTKNHARRWCCMQHKESTAVDTMSDDV